MYANPKFAHDNYNIETTNKYIRRFERLKDIILNSTEELYFIYTSQSSLEHGNFTIHWQHIIKDVYIYLHKIYELIGKYRNNYKMVLFDAIYEKDIKLLHENIILCKLDRCNNWYDFIIRKMIKYSYIFK